MFDKIIQRGIPRKKFMETLSLFSQGKMPEKGVVLPKLDWARDVTERININ